MQTEIITSRLTLRSVSWETTEEISDNQYDSTDRASYLKEAIDANPEVLDDAKEIMRVLDKMLDALKGDRSCWGAFLGKELIGYVNIVRPETDMPMLQYEIKKAYQHKGYGYEAVLNVLQAYWKQHPGKRVSAFIRPDNAASIALIKRLGGVLLPPGSLLEGIMFSTYTVAVGP